MGRERARFEAMYAVHAPAVRAYGREGQPQVQKALTGDGRGDPNMRYRALDASGRQIGKTTYAWPPEWANTTQAERQRRRR